MCLCPRVEQRASSPLPQQTAALAPRGVPHSKLQQHDLKAAPHPQGCRPDSCGLECMRPPFSREAFEWLFHKFSLFWEQEDQGGWEQQIVVVSLVRQKLRLGTAPGVQRPWRKGPSFDLRSLLSRHGHSVQGQQREPSALWFPPQWLHFPSPRLP